MISLTGLGIEEDHDRPPTEDLAAAADTDVMVPSSEGLGVPAPAMPRLRGAPLGIGQAGALSRPHFPCWQGFWLAGWLALTRKGVSGAVISAVWPELRGPEPSRVSGLATATS